MSALSSARKPDRKISSGALFIPRQSIAFQSVDFGAVIAALLAEKLVSELAASGVLRIEAGLIKPG